MKNEIHSLILVGYSPAHNGWVSLLVNEAGEIFDHQTRKNWGLFGGDEPGFDVDDPNLPEWAAKVAKEEGLIAAPLRAIPGDLVRVDRDKNLLADPNEFGSWENFEKAVNNSGLELSWDYGTDREGWRVEAKVPDNHIVDEDDEDYEDENNF